MMSCLSAFLNNLWVQAFAIVGLAALATIAAVIRLYAHITCGRCHSTRKMSGKTIIVTGATGGIGRETAEELARRGARVILACRNADSACKARDEIVSATGNRDVHVKLLDLSRMRSVREFAADVLRTETRLDVLIHNAGMADVFRKQVTEDGLEMTMATNYYGPFLLTHLLIDLLKKSAPSRIVIVASELYKFSRLNLDNLNPINTIPAYLYYVSKYANICFSNELARRLQGTNVTANCLHPGMIDSGIWRNIPFPLNYPVKLVTKGFFKTPKQGCQTTVYLAVSEEVEGVNGKYFLDCKESSLKAGAKDEAKNKKLWELSEDLVKLQPTDPRI
ncbi:retinol dehydrogenase 14-like [Ctenocephalides felis]|uniref:retinol dehydrogenase 14-like n=1 Tax=Ctenocephalides felis TaxID=7515 RepID=UPI000E6E452D|nr:retinol dehydrogenase 14-like [Ctenocephalides felis]